MNRLEQKAITANISFHRTALQWHEFHEVVAPTSVLRSSFIYASQPVKLALVIPINLLIP